MDDPYRQTYPDDAVGRRVLEQETTILPDGTRTTRTRQVALDDAPATRPALRQPRTATHVRRAARPRRIVREERLLYARWGLARSCGVVLGLAFAALAAGNFYFASIEDGGSFAGIPVHGSVVVGVLHGLVALLLLAAAATRERAAKGVVGAAGVLLAATAVLGAVIPDAMGEALLMGGPFPMALVAFHAICAGICIVCALLPTPRRRQVLERNVTPAATRSAGTTVIDESDDDGTTVVAGGTVVDTGSGYRRH